MRKINVFNHVSVDCCFAGPSGEFDWFKGRDDPEVTAFTQQVAKSDSALIFGRKTYQMMERFWPTEQAKQMDPLMAEKLINSPKIVFSKTIEVKETPDWKNITLIKEITPEAINKLKSSPGPDLTIIGSGSIVRQLGDMGFIDQYQLMVNPLILGSGKPLFHDMNRHDLKLVDAKVFKKSGLVLLTYQQTHLYHQLSSR